MYTNHLFSISIAPSGTWHSTNPAHCSRTAFRYSHHSSPASELSYVRVGPWQCPVLEEHQAKTVPLSFLEAAIPPPYFWPPLPPASSSFARDLTHTAIEALVATRPWTVLIERHLPPVTFSPDDPRFSELVTRCERFLTGVLWWRTHALQPNVDYCERRESGFATSWAEVLRQIQKRWSRRVKELQPTLALVRDLIQEYVCDIDILFDPFISSPPPATQRWYGWYPQVSGEYVSQGETDKLRQLQKVLWAKAPTDRVGGIICSDFKTEYCSGTATASNTRSISSTTTRATSVCSLLHLKTRLQRSSNSSWSILTNGSTAGPLALL